jgi:hypothetical protein
MTKWEGSGGAAGTVRGAGGACDKTVFCIGGLVEVAEEVKRFAT